MLACPLFFKVFLSHAWAPTSVVPNSHLVQKRTKLRQQTTLVMGSNLFQDPDHASVYIKYRPTPPTSLVDHILSYLEEEVR